MAMALQHAGADALVLFNRFYQPDIDLTRLQVLTDLKLSEPNEIRLPLLWLAVLAGRTKASLAASTGVTSADEVVKYLLVGADVVMTTSSLLLMSHDHMAALLAGLNDSMRRFESLEDVRGIMSQRSLRDPQAFERANYIKILHGYRQPDRSMSRTAGGPQSIAYERRVANRASLIKVTPMTSPTDLSDKKIPRTIRVPDARGSAPSPWKLS